MISFLRLWERDPNGSPMTVHIGRRKFLGALGGAVVMRPLEAWPQVLATERPLVAWLSGSASRMAGAFADDFLDGMRGFGAIDGRNFDFVPRYAEGLQ
jgi:hypothetical protein